ncbi:AAA-like domain protein [Posidoniimonas polymericola]|uniref:AAA-like domain protein n=1 Tax=Posidoniimonas polymericola TaxID=2528002 RepID=A0A5C5ZFK3_9BACT|nr:DUF87 domain-containing protein [Posidoniimonas polymericola]TWT85880.1 AAA-like domain protein [Posidoniimonas polymericola]
MPDLDSKNHFYLGRRHDLSSGETDAEAPLLLKSNDLTTHAVCVGMTGSGKTGLCLSLLEEAALDGVPAIAIDPKGDLGNLLLAFPNLAPSDFRPWIDESVARRKGQTPDQFAESTAELWRNGLAGWGEGPERIQRYNDSVERLIFTPGSSAGIPLTVMKSFNAPPREILADAEMFRERVASAVSGLLALLGIDADPVRSREHIFLSTVLTTAWQAGQDLDIAEMIREIQDPPFETVGVMELDAFFPKKDRTALAMDLNNLLASPSFAGWMEGAPLDVQQLLYSPEGKPRLSIISIAHLDDAQRMFFVTILLNEMLAWMRTQPGTGSLRALLYMDEVYGYFPPVANPPSKRPMLTLLKQARAFGVGCVLATQNPVDLDYKGLSNCGAWFLGRLQTERDKARVIEGLEGASAQAGSGFDKQAMEATLAALGSRVFLLNNVHADAPEVFHTRWAMSYLAGPLTRTHIKRLMDGVREKFLPAPANQDKAAKADRPADTMPAPAPTPAAQASVADGVEQLWVAIREQLPADAQVEYRPALLGSGKAHFVDRKPEVDVWRDLFVMKSQNELIPDGVWEGALVYDVCPKFTQQPVAGVAQAPLPAELAEAKQYKTFAKDLEEWIYQEQRLTLYECESLDEVSRPDEDEQQFRARLAEQARLRLLEEQQKVEQSYSKKIARAEEKVAKKQSYYDEQRSQFWGRIGGFLMKVLELVLSLAGGKATKRKQSTSVTAARQAATEHGQASRAKQALEEAQAELEALREEQEQAVADVKSAYSPDTLRLTPVEVPPRKSDIDVSRVVLAWLPYELSNSGGATPAY